MQVFTSPPPQEEYLLAGLMSFAVSTLLASLKTENAQDYVYACFFLISVSNECT